MALFWKKKEPQPESETLNPGELKDREPMTEEFVDQAPLNPAVSVVATSGEPEKKSGFFGRVKNALSQRIQRTREDIVGQIKEAIKAAGKVDENLLERIEEILIKADVGAETTLRIVDEMRDFEARGASPDELLGNFKKQLLDIVGRHERNLDPRGGKPYVVLVVGVNGVGKTTTIGKIAAQYHSQGKTTMLVAGDTFRAAAVEQLQIWANRTSSVFVSKEMGADPAGIAYDAINQAKEQNVDVVLIDTAGRLHTKVNLMEELKKIVRVVSKLMPGAPHETVLVLDATTGQNAISQAKVFTESIPITALIMTKLDGTAKGGVLIGIRNLFDVPVVKIGIGEGVEDLRDFRATEFVDALFED